MYTMKDFIEKKIAVSFANKEAKDVGQLVDFLRLEKRGVRYLTVIRDETQDKRYLAAIQLEAYCKIEAFKYIWRCEKKNGNEDIRKAIWYLQKYLSLKEKKEVEKVDPN